MEGSVKSRILPAGSFGLAGTVGELCLHGIITPWADPYYGEFKAADVRGALNSLGPVDALVIDINCPGGHTAEGSAVMAILDGLTCKKIVFVSGMALSYGSVLAMAADPGQLYVYELAELMIHNPWTITIGDQQAHLQAAADLDVRELQIANVYLRRPQLGDLGEAGILDLMQAETYFTASDAVERGFADRVVRNLAEIAQGEPPAEATPAEATPGQVLAFRSRHAVQLFSQFHNPLARTMAAALGSLGSLGSLLPGQSQPAPAAEIDLRMWMPPDERAAELEILNALPVPLREKRVAVLSSRQPMAWAREGARAKAETAVGRHARQLPPAALSAATDLLEHAFATSAAGPDAHLLESVDFAAGLLQVFAALPESPLLGPELAVPAANEAQAQSDTRSAVVRQAHLAAGLTDEKYLELKRRYPNASW